MLLRDVMMPLPMREGWAPEMEWPYPGVPASVVASFAGHRVAALPFFAPETVTTDHGSVYKPRPRGSTEGPGLQHPPRPHAASPG